MIAVPEAFAGNVIRSSGDDGRRWLADLPHLIDECCTYWRLAVDGAPMHGHLGLVLPVRTRDAPPLPCVLKLSWAAAHTGLEARALRAWDGRGAVRLLAAAPERGALLLERLDTQRSLADLDLTASLPIVGRLLRRLAIPAPAGFPLLSEVAARLVDDIPPRWERFGQPFSRALLEQTRGLARELGPVAGDRLVHWDLYDNNILAGERELWLAIDPMVVTGDPEYGAAPALLRGVDRMTGPADFQRHLAALIDAAELDPQRTCGWAKIRLVDYWLWALGIGLTEDPIRCATVIDWLWP